MCTVSWLHEPRGYQLFCNRDERKTRKPAAGPRIHRRDGVWFLAPEDGEAGGTWIGTNEFGLTLCLLNGRGSARIPERPRSRGLLLPDLLSSVSIEEALERVDRFDLSFYAPFTVAMLEPGCHAGLAEWNGRDRIILPFGEPFLPLVSSSFDPDGVARSRRDQFRRQLSQTGRERGEAHQSFHRSHSPDAGPYSPCMHRADAETVSFTWVRVNALRAEWRHTPAAPCQASRVETVGLSLRQ
jgi:hypothetical protein